MGIGDRLYYYLRLNRWLERFGEAQTCNHHIVRVEYFEEHEVKSKRHIHFLQAT